MFCYCVFQRPLVPKAAGGRDSSSGPGTLCSSSTGCSGGQSISVQAPLAAQKAKLLDSHVPSLKRRKLSEYHSEFMIVKMRQVF